MNVSVTLNANGSKDTTFNMRFASISGNFRVKLC